MNAEEKPGRPDRQARAAENLVINQACQILGRRLCWRRGEPEPDGTKAAARYLWLKLAQRSREVFAVLLLDRKGRFITYKELFHGTVDRSVVYPREVVRFALLRNAAAVILAHNHPSGDPCPSKEDIEVTERIKQGLNLVDIELRDHMVVGSERVMSFATKKLIGVRCKTHVDPSHGTPGEVPVEVEVETEVEPDEGRSLSHGKLRLFPLWKHKRSPRRLGHA